MLELYAAYGSNTNESDWRRWCREKGYDPDCIRTVGPAILPDVALAFNYYSASRMGGALNIMPCVGAITECLLFEVAGDGWSALDEKEGAPHAYERRRCTAILSDGACIPVATYVVAADRVEDHFVPPTDEYLKIVKRGFRVHGLSLHSLERAATGEAPDTASIGIFVYGTLMRGEARFAEIAAFGLDRVVRAQVRGRLVDCGAFPALVPGEGGAVKGEFMRPKDLRGALPRLDEIEGARPFGAPGGLYRRTLIEVKMGDGEACPAWVYVGDAVLRGDLPIIASGCWRTRTDRSSYD